MLDTSKKYLVTGVAGFIGYSVAFYLLKNNCNVIGIDNLNDYYDLSLKMDRLNEIKGDDNFEFISCDISNKEKLLDIFDKHRPNFIIHLAAQAGVRNSIDNPDSYIESNIVGFFNILEACRFYPIIHLLYASSSSVYGANEKTPFEESDFVDSPVSLYAATKKSNELMAYTYSHLYNITCTGLRFFTVYGPMGRPDMAYFKFVNMYFNQQPIHIYNNGDFLNDMYRDFTYIDDIVEAMVRLLQKPPVNYLPQHRIFNIGNNKPEKLMDFIATLETCLGVSLGQTVEFKKKFDSIKPGDVLKTFASVKLLEKEINFKPTTSLKDGLQKFTDWYVKYYNKL